MKTELLKTRSIPRAGRRAFATRIAAYSVVLALVPAAVARGEESLSAPQWVARGNDALKAGKFDEALEAFGRADASMPQSPEIAYDRGIAQYRKGDFDKARAAFGDALRTRDPSLEAHAKYNLGNCAYSTALQKLTDMQGAIDELHKALSYYRDALALNPDDKDTRQNIERAQLLIKDLIDKEKKRQEEERKKQEEEQKKNPQSQPSSQPNQDQQDQKQQQQKQQKKGEKKDQPDDQKDKQPQKSQSQQEKNKDDKKKQEKKQKQQSEGKPEKRELNKDEAERLLQAIRDKERSRREDRRKREAMLGGKPPVEKDW